MNRKNRRNAWRKKLRRCWQCKNYKTWYSTGTWCSPEEYGWDCRKQSDERVQDLQEEFMNLPGDEYENLMGVAKRCPFYIGGRNR